MIKKINEREKEFKIDNNTRQEHNDKSTINIKNNSQ